MAFHLRPTPFIFMPKVAFFCLMSACQLSVIGSLVGSYRWEYLAGQKGVMSVVAWLGSRGSVSLEIRCQDDLIPTFQG